MGKKSKVVDLVLNEDGSYEPIKKNDEFQGTRCKGKGLVKTPMGEKPKYIRENHADEFLSGIDAGLDLIDKFVPRIERFLRLRG
jgi:hypothetical protein